MRIVFTLCFTLLISTAVLAEKLPKDSVKLEELVVTGSKFETSRNLIPLSISQISENKIQQSGQYNVLSTLGTYVPGLFVTERNILGFGVSNGGAGFINFRGINTNEGIGNYPNTQLLVLIDGHPQYQGIFSHPLSDAYVSSDVEKVEVIRGPASVLYGSNAMGGVINIITKKQHQEGFSANLNATYGSYNTQKYAGTIGYKKDKFSLFAAANYDKTDGIRSNTEFDIQNGYIKLGYELNSHWQVSADFNLAHFNANDDGPVDAPALFKTDITRGKAAISIDNIYGNTDGSIKIFHNFGDHDLSDGFKSKDRNSGMMIFQNYHFSQNTHITLGLDAKQFGGTASTGMAANQLKTVNEIAAYTLLRQKFLNILDFNAGIRYENNSAFGSEWVPMAGLAVQASATTNFKASVSKGFRSPSVMELYLYTPNPDLKPERLINYELSWLQSYIDNKFNTELTFFLAEGSNMIKVEGVGPGAKRKNLGNFTNYGVEFSTAYTINKHIAINANYSYLHLNRKIVVSPKHQANLSLLYNYKKFNANLTAQHIQGMYSSTVPEVIQNYTVLNIRASYQVLKNLNIFASAHNLLNQRYEIQYGYPMPGINFHGGINISF